MKTIQLDARLSHPQNSLVSGTSYSQTTRTTILLEQLVESVVKVAADETSEVSPETLGGQGEPFLPWLTLSPPPVVRWEGHAPLSLSLGGL